jgi:hypothetical protein
VKLLELEAWAREVLKRVENMQPIEDSRVEIKDRWIEPAKAARRIAGHANAARGENILWLIGADEKGGRVTGADQQELATWFPQVKAFFDSEVPGLQEIHFEYETKGGETKTVTALYFDASRFPFLVKTPKAGEVQFEVPWREGTQIRSARRCDVLSMLLPLIRMPKLELLGGQIDTTSSAKATRFNVIIYLVPVGTEPLTFPFHRCKARLIVANEVRAEAAKIAINSPRGKRELRNVNFREVAKMTGGTWVAPERDAITIATHGSAEATEQEIVVRGCGQIEVDGVFEIQPDENWSEFQIHLSLAEAVSELDVKLEARFVRREPWVWMWTLGD